MILLRASLTSDQVQGMSWQTCEDTVCRREFAANGTLNSNANNMTSRPINEYKFSWLRLSKKPLTCLLVIGLFSLSRWI